MTIDYPADKQFQLWIRDTGKLDTVAVFVNGELSSFIANQSTNKFPIDRPATTVAVVVHFGGADSGHSAIVDVTSGETGLAQLGPSDGTHHSYILRAV